MRNNPANQAVVKEMDPVGVVSDSGEVLPLPEKLKQKKTASLEEL
jgi:ataxin-10